MKSFFSVTKTKIIIFFSLMLVAIIIAIFSSFLQNFLINNAISNDDQTRLFKIILPAMNNFFIFVKLYLYTCLSVYILKKMQTKEEAKNKAAK